MKTKTTVTAGARGFQHNQTVVSKKLKTGVKAGGRGYQHNQRVVHRRTLKLKKTVSACQPAWIDAFPSKW